MVQFLLSLLLHNVAMIENVVNLTRKNIFFWGRGEAVWDKMCLLPSEGGNLTNAIVVPELPGSLIPLLFN